MNRHIVLIRVVGIPDPIARFYAHDIPFHDNHGRVSWVDDAGFRMLAGVKHCHPSRTGDNDDTTVIVLHRQ